MDCVTIGKIVRPQGIKGEVKVLPLTDDPERFCKLKKVFLNDGEAVGVLRCRITNGDVFLYLEGVSDRNRAETLRGAYIKIEATDKIKLPAGRYFIVDLVGCAVAFEDGQKIGTVADILQYGAADVYVLTPARAGGASDKSGAGGTDGAKSAADAKGAGAGGGAKDAAGAAGANAAAVGLRNPKTPTIMFPALQSVILHTDVEGKIITVSKKRFGEVAVYEN
jgi:16S rRNA processing protein RimM